MTVALDSADPSKRVDPMAGTQAEEPRVPDGDLKEFWEEITVFEDQREQIAREKFHSKFEANGQLSADKLKYAFETILNDYDVIEEFKYTGDWDDFSEDESFNEMVRMMQVSDDRKIGDDD